uniref:unspecific monooxygenase n=1 Tax=Heliothis virescens TaxID=7102 RepID=A0A2A4JW58_HELVI
MLTLILTFVSLVLAIAYLKGKYNEHYWKKRGVPFYDKHRTGGPLWQFGIEDRSFFQILHDIYWKYEKDPAVGLGSLFNHGLYVKDPKNIQHITQVDFHSFNHRGIAFTDDDILANNVLLLHGPKWKIIRQKLTPIFTTAKLRNMFYIIDKSAQDFVEYLKLNPEKLNADAFENMSHFCTAAIAAAVFGIGTKSTFDSPFREMAREVLTPTFTTNLKFMISGISEFIFKTLKLKLFKTTQEDFFIGAIKQVLRQREQDNVPRHDFVEMCVNLQKSGTMEDSETGLKLEPTDELLAAQAFFFFLAGIEPTAASMFAAFMELGRHPEILKRLHKDVDEVFEKHNGKLTYDAVSDMKYLSNVLNESLRLYPPIGFLTRQCIQDTVLPVGDVPVEKGVKIFTPIYELHHDPKYFPEPEKFDPERFDRVGEVSDMTYMPFGKGGRYCIGARYARIQLLTGMVHLLRHYTVQTHVYKGGVQYSKEQFQVRLKNVNVEFIPRKL